MAKKPTYKELKQRVKDLEAEVVEYKEMIETLNSYQQIISTVTDLMSFLNKDYKYLAVNDAYLDFFPDKFREDIIGHTPSDLIGVENFLSQIKPNLDQCLTGAVVNYQGMFEFSGKGNRFMDINYHPVFAKDGTVSGIVHISRDITRLKQTEEALRKSEGKYRLLVDSATIGIVVTRDRFLKLVNPKAVELTGYSEEALISRPFVDFIHPDDQTMVMEHHFRRLDGQKVPESYALRIISKDGKTIWLENSGVLFTWEDQPATLNFLTDVTERKRAENALHKSENQKKTILDISLDQIRYVDTDLKIIWANETVSSELGVPPEDVIGQFCYKLLRGRDAPCERCPTIRARETCQVERSDMLYRGRKIKKEEKYWDLFSAPLMDEKNEVSGFIQIARNVTEKKKAEQALRQSERELTIRNQIAKLFLTITGDEIFGDVLQVILEAMDSQYGIFGYIDHDGAFVCPSLTIDIWEQCQIPEKKTIFPRETWGNSIWARCLIEKKAISSNEPFKVPDGHIPITRALSVPLIHQGEAIGNLMVGNKSVDYDEKDIELLETIVEHIAPILSAKLQIDRQERERQQAEDRVRKLSQMLMQAQERERQMISYELHDRIAQNLSTLKIGYDTLLKYQQGISHELEEKTAKYSKIAEQTITAVRDLAYDLRPPGLEDMNFVQAIEIYCEEFSENSGMEVDFQSAGMHTLKLADDTKIHLYRLVQEGFNNIRKHADAGRATVRLVGTSPNIILRIEDDGKGFDVQARELALDDEKRMGLRSMQERVNLLQGQMTVRSKLMKGTKIFIKLPIKEQNNESEEADTNH